MVIIDDVLVSPAVVEECFACDILKCKGACCIEGELGAPLEKSELQILDEIYEEVKPYLREKGRQAISDQGTYVFDFTGDYSTPLIDGGECAYVTFSESGIAMCGIEQAWHDGKIDFQKPISCHLYPVRIVKSKKLEALNYDRWEICSAACHKGAASQTHVYEFVKDALIRKYGEAFYEVLDKAVKN